MPRVRRPPPYTATPEGRTNNHEKTGASLVRHALEQLGIQWTFGIPGVHNTEMYDELNQSESILPTLVTHEMSAAFMADAVSRTGAGVGTLLIVPAAGVTHAASGIGEAGIDGIPMLIISGGIHTASGTRYQLHEMDQHALLAPITKKTWQITRHSDVIPTLYEAYNTAVTGEPDQCSWRFPTTSVTLSGMWMTCPTSRRRSYPRYHRKHRSGRLQKRW